MSEITVVKKVFDQIEEEQTSYLISNEKVKEGEIISIILDENTLLKRKVIACIKHEGLKDGYKLLIIERLKRGFLYYDKCNF